MPPAMVFGNAAAPLVQWPAVGALSLPASAPGTVPFVQCLSMSLPAGNQVMMACNDPATALAASSRVMDGVANAGIAGAAGEVTAPRFMVSQGLWSVAVDTDAQAALSVPGKMVTGDTALAGGVAEPAPLSPASLPPVLPHLPISLGLGTAAVETADREPRLDAHAGMAVVVAVADGPFSDGASVQPPPPSGERGAPQAGDGAAVVPASEGAPSAPHRMVDARVALKDAPQLPRDAAASGAADKLAPLSGPLDSLQASVPAAAVMNGSTVGLVDLRRVDQPVDGAATPPPPAIVASEPGVAPPHPDETPRADTRAAVPAADLGKHPRATARARADADEKEAAAPASAVMQQTPPIAMVSPAAFALEATLEKPENLVTAGLPSTRSEVAPSHQGAGSLSGVGAATGWDMPRRATPLEPRDEVSGTMADGDAATAAGGGARMASDPAAIGGAGMMASGPAAIGGAAMMASAPATVGGPAMMASEPATMVPPGTPPAAIESPLPPHAVEGGAPRDLDTSLTLTPSALSPPGSFEPSVAPGPRQRMDGPQGRSDAPGAAQAASVSDAGAVGLPMAASNAPPAVAPEAPMPLSPVPGAPSQLAPLRDGPASTLQPREAAAEKVSAVMRDGTGAAPTAFAQGTPLSRPGEAAPPAMDAQTPPLRATPERADAPRVEAAEGGRGGEAAHALRPSVPPPAHAADAAPSGTRETVERNAAPGVDEPGRAASSVPRLHGASAADQAMISGGPDAAAMNGAGAPAVRPPGPAPASSAGAAPGPASPSTDEPSASAQVGPVLVSLSRGVSGTQRTTVHLRPDTLGAVQVRVDRIGEAATRIDITVQRPETLTLLLRDQPQLERTLAQAGLPIDSRSLTFHVDPQALPPQAEPSALPANGGGAMAQGGFANPQNGGGQNQGHAAGSAGRDAQADWSAEPTSPDQPTSRWWRAGLDITA